MSYYDEDRAEPSLTLGDVVRTLKGADRDALNDLMAKALDAINADSGGLVERLKDENRTLHQGNLHLARQLEIKGKALDAAILRTSQLETSLAERQRVLGLTDHERAADLAAENDRLKETVRIQRDLLNRHDLAERAGNSVPPPSDSPWSLFKAGLSSAFVKPMGA